ncbi:hypothetical protein [Caldisericum sp.]|uniref:hypothetical protein n=1 Tax=Caldisericum sp. TaxID=2499687 RepID=UPI003D0D6B4E
MKNYESPTIEQAGGIENEPESFVLALFLVFTIAAGVLDYLVVAQIYAITEATWLVAGVHRYIG